MQSTGEDGTTLHNNISSNCIYESRIEGHFCSDAIFSRKILTETKIKVLEKGLNSVPIQNMTNKPELGIYSDIYIYIYMVYIYIYIYGIYINIYIYTYIYTYIYIYGSYLSLKFHFYRRV